MKRVKLGVEEDIEDRSPAYRGSVVGGLSGNRPLQVSLATTRHGAVYGAITYKDMAHLLSREDLDQILTEMRRDNRHSGVESLDDIGTRTRSLDDYHDVSVEDGPHLPDNETVEVEKNHLRRLRQAAQAGHRSVATRVALRGTEDLL